MTEFIIVIMEGIGWVIKLVIATAIVLLTVRALS